MVLTKKYTRCSGVIVTAGGGNATVEGDVCLGGERGRQVGGEVATIWRLREEHVEGLLAVVLNLDLGPTC
jgi:hypothetical protein